MTTPQPYDAPGCPAQRSGTSTAIVAVIGLVAVLAIAGLFSLFSAAPPSSETTTPTLRLLTHSPPEAPPTGGETKFLKDLSAAGITSSTAKPEALVARGKQVCSDLTAGKSQDEAAADIVSSSNHFFDETTAETIVRVAIKDLCPQ